jgi:hypothetical protein
MFTKPQYHNSYSTASPANISTNSLPTALRKVTPASPAMARARYVLPVPGGPWKMMPCGCGQTWRSNIGQNLEKLWSNCVITDKWIDGTQAVWPLPPQATCTMISKALCTCIATRREGNVSNTCFAVSTAANSPWGSARPRACTPGPSAAS